MSEQECVCVCVCVCLCVCVGGRRARTSLCMLDHVSELKANGAEVRGGEVQRITGPAGREGGRRKQLKRGRVREREKERVEHRTDDKL